MIVTLAPGGDAVAAIATATGESVVVLIGPGRSAGDALLARAAIMAAALDRAPRRINAVQLAGASTSAAIDRTVAFLMAAPAITGQIIDLS